ncbi:MAG: DUF1441 family protein [Devosia sp.]|nr:DUF1441 family protein [Devosia sp.]
MFDDLLGNSVQEEPEIAVAPYGRDFSLKMGDVHAISRGVTIPWLCQAFTLGRKVVLARLAECPAIKTQGNGSKVYDLRQAAAYLVKPRFNIESYIKNLDPADLPERLKREFWMARKIEQQVRVAAADLWTSNDVMSVFGEVFKIFKNSTEMWVDNLEESAGLDDRQRARLTELVDELRTSIEKSLTDYATVSHTRSQLAELDEDDVE